MGDEFLTYREEFPTHREGDQEDDQKKSQEPLNVMSKNEEERSFKDLLSEYVTSLYLAHKLDAGSIKLDDIEKKQIPYPINPIIWMSLIERAIEIFKIVKEKNLKNDIFDLILKCSNILLNKDEVSFEQLGMKLEPTILMNLIKYAIIMFVTIRDDIFDFILKCSNILLDKEDLSYEEALNISTSTLDIMVNDVDIARFVAEDSSLIEKSLLSIENSLRNWKEVQKKLKNVQQKIPSLLYLVKDAKLIETRKSGYENWKTTEDEIRLQNNLDQLVSSIPIINSNTVSIIEEKEKKRKDKEDSVVESLKALRSSRYLPELPERSLSSRMSEHRRKRAQEREQERLQRQGSQSITETKGGMATRKKKYRRRNKTKRYKRQQKRYTKKYRMRY